jgi:hypothetical protein
MLPDIALLGIFDFYVNKDKAQVQAWHTLVHVCQKWRNVVFGSPRRLNLRLHCIANTPVREMLNVWPPFPIVVWVRDYVTLGVDNTLAALKHNDRICQLGLFYFPSLQLEKVLAAMQQPFPALKYLRLGLNDETGLVIPDSFLGGSAPCLKKLVLYGIIPFPKLLLSATHLVHLSLCRIPHSGYISPEALAACFSALTSLKSLFIGFESPQSCPDRNNQHPSPPTRSLLPVLTRLWFRGVAEYLEDLVARIDAPLLDKFTITFFHRLIFDSPRLTHFISRTPKFKTLGEARVVFSNQIVTVTIPQIFDGELEVGILCKQSDWQLSSVAQVCGSFFPQALIPTVERLYVLGKSWPLHWQDDIENDQWLELFHPFTAVKDFYVSSEFTPRIAPALQELVGERVTEVLPALQTLFLGAPLPSGPVHESIGQFVAARQLAGHPIAVSRWKV